MPEYEFKCPGHNSIYYGQYAVDNYKKREYTVYFNTPQQGVTNETGILLLIPGFGVDIGSKVYKKMRGQFADQYNLVTVQCNYFGFEFMNKDTSSIFLTDDQRKILQEQLTPKEIQNIFSDSTFNFEQLIKISMEKKITLNCKAILQETVENFNDMGYMQSLDNINAILSVIAILFNNNQIFNTSKIMIMGNSHGAYLAYLCNRLCPNLFSYILDNSAWNYPRYLEGDRIVKGSFEGIDMKIGVEYLAKTVKIKVENLRISTLYKGFENQCKIVCYHGVDDELISIDTKKNELKDINNIIIEEINKERLDNIIFKDTKHGLGADFLELFSHFYNKYVVNNKMSSTLKFDNIVQLPISNMKIDYSEGRPVVK